MQKLSFMHRLTLGILVSVILFGVCFTYMTGITTAVNGIATYYPYQIPTIVNGTVTYTYMQIRPPFPQPFWELVFSFSVAFIPIAIVVWDHQQANGQSDTSGELTVALKEFLQQFKENKSGAIGRGYDPDPRRSHKRSHGRRGRVPPQLRSWVFGRRRRTHDPSRARGALLKPVYTGPRAGRYFQGPTRRRYDPDIRGRLGGYRRRSYGYGGAGYARGRLGQIEKFFSDKGHYIGFLLGLLPTWQSYNKYAAYDPTMTLGRFIGTEPHPDDKYYMSSVKTEMLTLVGQDPRAAKNPSGKTDWPVDKYLQYKFLNTESSWCIPFWLSLIGFVLSKLKVIPQRLNRIVGPIATGSLVSTTIGALMLPACGRNEEPSPQALQPPPPPSNSFGQNPPKTIEFTYRG